MSEQRIGECLRFMVRFSVLCVVTVLQAASGFLSLHGCLESYCRSKGRLRAAHIRWPQERLILRPAVTVGLCYHQPTSREETKNSWLVTVTGYSSSSCLAVSCSFLPADRQALVSNRVTASHKLVKVKTSSKKSYVPQDS